jgi:hypothetical protein
MQGSSIPVHNLMHAAFEQSVVLGMCHDSLQSPCSPNINCWLQLQACAVCELT